MPKTHARYLRWFFIVTAGLLLVTAAINVLVDPYDIARVFVREGVNVRKPMEWEYGRLHKPIAIGTRMYDGVVLGTSQVERGFDPLYQALTSKGLSLYNLGLSEMRPYETAILLRYAREVSHIQFAIIVLDFLRYDTPPASGSYLPPDWEPSWLVKGYARTVFSFRGLLDSLSTLKANQTGAMVFQHLPSGVLDVEKQTMLLPSNYGVTFDAINSTYLNETYHGYVERAADLRTMGFNHQPLIDMLRFARSNGIQLYFVIPPTHASQQEVVEFLGLQPLMDQWKMELICVLDEARENELKMFPLWDFSGYNSVTMEPVPSQGDSQAKMRWYNDPIHFSIRTGNAILDKVLELKDPQFSTLNDFGSQVNPEGIGLHLAAIRAKRDRYVLAHPEVVSGIASLYRGEGSGILHLEGIPTTHGCWSEPRSGDVAKMAMSKGS